MESSSSTISLARAFPQFNISTSTSASNTTTSIPTSTSTSRPTSIPTSTSAAHTSSPTSTDRNSENGSIPKKGCQPLRGPLFESCPKPITFIGNSRDLFRYRAASSPVPYSSLIPAPTQTTATTGTFIRNNGRDSGGNSRGSAMATGTTAARSYPDPLTRIINRSIIFVTVMLCVMLLRAFWM